MKKLFTVIAEFQFVIVARDEEHAALIARKTAQEALRDQSPDDVHLMIREGVHADGWDERSYPYGDLFAKTIGEYLEQA